jgi:hypothetical protein
MDWVQFLNREHCICMLARQSRSRLVDSLDALGGFVGKVLASVIGASAWLA